MAGGLTDLTDAATQVAQGPANTNVDGMQVQQHKLRDLDDVNRSRGADRAVKKPRRGLLFNKPNAPAAA